MKDVAPADRPREKLDRLGPAALGDNELLAIVLGNGCRGATSLDVANEILVTLGGLHGTVRAGTAALARVPGIGLARARQVVAALELGRRSLGPAPAARLLMRTPRDVAGLLLPVYGARPVEHFGVVLLDTRHRVLRTSVLAVGGLNSTVVQPREVFREAALGSAAALVAFHNHPSGDPSPSPDDVELTRRLVSAGSIIGVEVVDHIILGDARYCSLREMGQL